MENWCFYEGITSDPVESELPDEKMFMPIPYGI